MEHVVQNSDQSSKAKSVRRSPKAKKSKGSFLYRLVIWSVRLLVGFVVGSVLLTAMYSVFDPPITPLMVWRSAEALLSGSLQWKQQEWLPYDEIPTTMFRSILAAEDARFVRHNGFDWKAIDDAKRYNERHKGKKVRGASTVTMQTAKNVFLWPDRTYVRKGLEAYFTVLIEAVWGKQRILEVYANVVEMGPGIYGVNAAAQHYFGKSAADLTNREAALIAAILPNPRRYSASQPSAYIRKRADIIQVRARSVPLPKD